MPYLYKTITKVKIYDLAGNFIRSYTNEDILYVEKDLNYDEMIQLFNDYYSVREYLAQLNSDVKIEISRGKIYKKKVEKQDRKDDLFYINLFKSVSDEEGFE